MSEIDAKHAELKAQGLDLGPPTGPEEALHGGGRVRRFGRGRICWHPETGAQAVHGSIDRHYAGMESTLGRPVLGNAARAGGEAAFFERGVIYVPQGAPGAWLPIIGYFMFPLMGQPGLIDPAQQVAQGVGFAVRWREMKMETYRALTAWRPSVFADIVRGMFAIAPSTGPLSQIPLADTGIRLAHETQFFTDVVAGFRAFAAGGRDLAERTLYDLQLNRPNGVPYALSPHCLYVKSNWDDFGLLHITDIHVCARNQHFRGMLQQRGLADAAAKYSNFQDNLADFIRYANRLHELGLADAVVATGDLIDYVAEEGDVRGEENFARLRRMILGQPFMPGMAAREGLRIPIYMTFGNHDYRLNPYDLVADIDLPGEGNDRGLNEHSTHNLLESDAIALQDGRVPVYGLTTMEGAGRMLEYDRFDNRYDYFKTYFTKERTYIVRFGRHRLVVMDTKMDNGIPENFDILTLLNVAYGGSGVGGALFGYGMPATRKLLAGGGPDSVGFGPDELGLLRNAVVEAGSDGIVMVGMHCPAISPRGSEYAYFHRETIHPTANPALTVAYLRRHGITDGSTWTKTGTRHFKHGAISDGMDSGVIAYGGEEFLRICAGVGLPRPVDLVLWGHHHDRVEYRIRWNGRLEYYTDFYSENPALNYHTINGADIPGVRPLPKGAVLQVRIDAGAVLPVAVGVTTDQRIKATYGVARTPPYADPLNATTNAKDWWIRHRPLLVQTSALGPIDPRQRFGTFYALHPPAKKYRPVVESDRPLDAPRGVSVEELPGRLVPPSFQGFRLVQVRGGAIARMRYIVLAELRRRNFEMPWENEFRGPRVAVFKQNLFNTGLLNRQPGNSG